MAVFYMKHPVHGTKVACSDIEVSYDQSKGWSQYDPNIAEVPSINILADSIKVIGLPDFMMGNDSET